MEERIESGKRIESRAECSLEVRVLGMDANGRPLLATARTVNISRHGVVLEGLAAPVGPGEVLSLQYKGRKVRYRVIWAGEAGTEKAGQLGLEQVNLHDDLWQQDMPAPQTTRDTRIRQAERRKQRRFQAELPVEVRSTQTAPIRAEIADISVSGCYVNTLFPVPVDSIVSIVFWLGDEKVTARGKVRSSILGVGCGIEFVDLSPAAHQLLEEFLRSRCLPADDRRRAAASPPAKQLAKEAEIEITVPASPSNDTD